MQFPLRVLNTEGFPQKQTVSVLLIRPELRSSHSPDTRLSHFSFFGKAVSWRCTSFNWARCWEIFFLLCSSVKHMNPVSVGLGLVFNAPQWSCTGPEQTHCLDSCSVLQLSISPSVSVSLSLFYYLLFHLMESVWSSSPALFVTVIDF